MQRVCSQDRGDVWGVGVPEGPQAGAVQAVPGRTFHSVDQVLKWAYAADQYRGAKIAGYTQFTAAETGGDRLNSTDRLAQAACIQARVDRMGGDGRDLVLALYSWSPSAQQSIDKLCRDSRCVIDNGPAALIEALVVRHCRLARRVGSESLRTIAMLHGVPWSTAKRRDELVRAWLGRMWLETEGALYRDWLRAGIIEP